MSLWKSIMNGFKKENVAIWAPCIVVAIWFEEGLNEVGSSVLSNLCLLEKPLYFGVLSPSWIIAVYDVHKKADVHKMIEKIVGHDEQQGALSNIKIGVQCGDVLLSLNEEKV